MSQDATIDRRVSGVLEASQRAGLIVQEGSLTTAVDWTPDSSRVFQIVSVHCGHWGHANWFGPPLNDRHLSEMLCGSLRAELPPPLLFAGLDGAARSLEPRSVPDAQYAFTGTLSCKTEQRFDAVVAELEMLAIQVLRRPLKQSTIATAGYFGELSTTHAHRFKKVRWCDCSLGDGLLQPTPDDNIVLISGCALIDHSLHDLLRRATDTGAVVVVLAQTCPSLMATILPGSCHLLLCEAFPFFFLDGTTLFAAYRWY